MNIYHKLDSTSVFTILRSVVMGRRKVSEKRRAGGFFGLDDGVWTAQHLMKIPMKMMNKIPISMQSHQNSCNFMFMGNKSQITHKLYLVSKNPPYAHIPQPLN